MNNDTEPEQWQARAACRGENPELFFPDPSDEHTRARAQTICATCPVRSECSNHAQPFGVWAGDYYHPEHGRKPRRHTTTGRPPGRPATAPCGTPAAYDRHRRNNEPPCGPCIKANSQAAMNRRKARKQTP